MNGERRPAGRGTALTAFTTRGTVLAEALAAALDGHLRTEDEPLANWARRSFESCEALVFVGAAGIAVRTVAPLIRNKTEDPAVVCVDETGRWVIPLLSGHLGGANALAERIASLTGGEAVITTATDLNGAFAVDLWAKKQGMSILQPERIKRISAGILRAETATLVCDRPIEGAPPEHVKVERGTDGDPPADVRVSFRVISSSALQLVPRVLTLGIGCRRGTEASVLEAALEDFCTERRILPQAVEQAASIDRKKDEAGLISFCEKHGWPLRFFSAGELGSQEGSFSGSAFVEATVGVDNVCERAAVCGAGGELIEKKYARAGVTFALAERPAVYDWST